jgi:hypothetical protein
MTNTELKNYIRLGFKTSKQLGKYLNSWDF